jgi:hypothetical protein
VPHINGNACVAWLQTIDVKAEAEVAIASAKKLLPQRWVYLVRCQLGLPSL